MTSVVRKDSVYQDWWEAFKLFLFERGDFYKSEWTPGETELARDVELKWSLLRKDRDIPNQYGDEWDLVV